MQEVWAQSIIDRYEVSNHGKVRNKKTKAMIKLQLDRYGYYIAASVVVHRLVCTAFHGPKPEWAQCVNHINGVKTDNRAENLEWSTFKANTRHAIDNGLLVHERGLHHFGKGRPKLGYEVAQEMRRRVAAGESQWQMHREYGVCRATVRKVVEGKRYNAI